MNYQGYARTNYFRVKDAQVFQAWAQNLPGVDLVTQADKADEVITPDTRFALLAAEDSSWPSSRITDKDIEEDVDVINDIIPFIADNEVVIFLETGREGMRYLSGAATAVNSKGEICQVVLNSIYDLAKNLVPDGTEVTRAEY